MPAALGAGARSAASVGEIDLGELLHTHRLLADTAGPEIADLHPVNPAFIARHVTALGLERFRWALPAHPAFIPRRLGNVDLSKHRAQR